MKAPEHQLCTHLCPALCEQDTIPALTPGTERAPAKQKRRQEQMLLTGFAKHISATRARTVTAFFFVLSPWVGFISPNLSVTTVSQLLSC